MKSNKITKRRVIITSLTAGVGLLALIAWTPSGGADIDLVLADLNIDRGSINMKSAGTKSTISGHTTIAIGDSNQMSGNKVLAVGVSNSHYGTCNLLVGSTNTLHGTTAAQTANHSAVIGYHNYVGAPYGWAVGWDNEVLASQGVAIGTGTKVGVQGGTAFGKYNASMFPNDLLVVGNGTGVNTRSTALRVTSEGAVILGAAQGDIPSYNGQ